MRGVPTSRAIVSRTSSEQIAAFEAPAAMRDHCCSRAGHFRRPHVKRSGLASSVISAHLERHFVVYLRRRKIFPDDRLRDALPFGSELISSQYRTVGTLQPACSASAPMVNADRGEGILSLSPKSALEPQPT
jgi:hypothetical protein